MTGPTLGEAYTSTSNIRDDEHRAAMKRNISKLQHDINETNRLRKDGQLIFVEDLPADHPIKIELERRRNDGPELEKKDFGP